ncbi:hypothetical protein [Mesorhizobium sp. M1E.F.Ca.ET.041.01.1.1]|nr:hypothetical protein [Mesorhizobium sp. M1E.F.Ca.ET.041.01.1.1]
MRNDVKVGSPSLEERHPRLPGWLPRSKVRQPMGEQTQPSGEPALPSYTE